MGWTLQYSKRAVKDAELLRRAGLIPRLKRLLEVLIENPFQNPPPYEKLTKDLRGKYSRRINVQHRLVYEVFKKEKVVRILTAWSHYE